jgi:hypothetical protein
VERKDLEDLIQRLWDQGASIEIMKILEHDKQQRESLSRVEAKLVEAVGLLKSVKDWFGYGDLPESLGKLESFLARHTQGGQQEEFHEGQWWLKELDMMVESGTPNQKRAVAVVRNMIGHLGQAGQKVAYEAL